MPHRPPATLHPQPISWCFAPATQWVAGLSTQDHTFKHMAKRDRECLASGECTWECRAKKAWSIPSSAMRSVLESILGSELESKLGGVLWSTLGVYLGAFWDLTMERKSSSLGVYNRVQLGASLGVCLGVDLWMNSECSWEHLASLIGSV